MANFTFDTSQLERGLLRHEQRLDAATVAVMEIYAEGAEDIAKSAHPWQNRSGDAELGLNAGLEYDEARHIVTLYLTHGDDIDYGWFLETVEFAHAGRLAIIKPTLEVIQEPLMAALRRMLR